MSKWSDDRRVARRILCRRPMGLGPLARRAPRRSCTVKSRRRAAHTNSAREISQSMRSLFVHIRGKPPWLGGFNPQALWPRKSANLTSVFSAICVALYAPRGSILQADGCQPRQYLAGSSSAGSSTNSCATHLNFWTLGTRRRRRVVRNRIFRRCGHLSAGVRGRLGETSLPTLLRP